MVTLHEVCPQSLYKVFSRSSRLGNISTPLLGVCGSGLQAFMHSYYISIKLKNVRTICLILNVQASISIMTSRSRGVMTLRLPEVNFPNTRPSCLSLYWIVCSSSRIPLGRSWKNCHSLQSVDSLRAKIGLQQDNKRLNSSILHQLQSHDVEIWRKM